MTACCAMPRHKYVSESVVYYIDCDAAIASASVTISSVSSVTSSDAAITTSSAAVLSADTVVTDGDGNSVTIRANRGISVVVSGGTPVPRTQHASCVVVPLIALSNGETRQVPIELAVWDASAGPS